MTPAAARLAEQRRYENRKPMVYAYKWWQRAILDRRRKELERSKQALRQVEHEMQHMKDLVAVIMPALTGIQEEIQHVTKH